MRADRFESAYQPVCPASLGLTDPPAADPVCLQPGRRAALVLEQEPVWLHVAFLVDLRCDRRRSKPARALPLARPAHNAGRSQGHTSSEKLHFTLLRAVSLAQCQRYVNLLHHTENLIFITLSLISANYLRTLRSSFFFLFFCFFLMIMIKIVDSQKSKLKPVLDSIISITSIFLKYC